MDDLSPLDANPFDQFDDQASSPAAPSVTQDNNPFGEIAVQPAPEQNLYDTFETDSQPDAEDEDGGWFNWFSSNVEGINQQESSEKFLKSTAEQTKAKPKGVFGESFGILSPDERQVWINETRSGAEESVKSWQEGIARTQKFFDEKGDSLNPQTRQAVLRNIQAGQAELVKAQQDLKDIQDVEAGKKPAATLTGWRSGVESGAQGLIDDVAAGIVKSAGIASHYASQGELPQQQLLRVVNSTWGQILGDEKMSSLNSEPDDNALYKVGELISEFAKEQFPGDEARQREFGQVLSRGAGNMIGFYGTAGMGALLKGGTTGMFLLTSALGAGVGGSHQFEDATKARERGEDVSELERLLSFMSGAALGATEAIPIMRSFAGGRGGFVGAMVRGAETSAEEAFQEGFQQIGQNLTAQQLYDPKRKISEGVGEGVMAGGILGFLGGAGVQSIIRPREFDPFKDLPAPPEIIDDGQSVTTTRPLPETAPEAPTEAAPQGKRGVDVIQFIRAKGGLKPSGELEAVDAKRYPGLVSGKGLGADQMREALVEAGYLEETGPDQPAITTPQDVFDLVGRAISGERIVPASDVQADQDFTQTQVVRQFDQEMLAAEENFVLPDIEEIDDEAGFPVLTEAYQKLSESERAEVVERNARGENVDDLIEEMAVRNDDRQTIAAMAIRKGLNDQQIGQLREMIQSQAPELAQGFEELLVQLPKQKEARQARGRQEAGVSPGLPKSMGAMTSARRQRSQASGQAADSQVSEGDTIEQQDYPSIEEAQTSRDLRRSFASALDSKAPRSQWAKKLGVTEEELQPLIDEAIQRKWLRIDKNGKVRRVPKWQRVGNLAALAIGDNLPDVVADEGSVVKTDAAQGRNVELQIAVDEAAAKILPEDIRVDVVDNIAIATLKKEDQHLALREEAAFQRWFGDSKVVDDNGEPMVVYHGSGVGGIEIFDTNKAGTVKKSDWGTGIYFSTSKASGDYYRTEAVLANDTEGDRLLKAYEDRARELGTRAMHEGIDLGFDSDGYKELQKLRLRWVEHRDNLRGSSQAGEVYAAYLSLQNPMIYKYEGITDPYLSEVAKEQGHDGIIIVNELPPSGEPLAEYMDEIIAFEPTQIKSAFGNRGTFDPADPRISYALSKSGSPDRIETRLSEINNEISDISRRAIRRPTDDGDLQSLREERERLIKQWNELPLQERSGKDELLALRAFHGSPHKFDQFDISKIGSGEGTQEQGYGFYLSDAMSQGETYQIQLGAGQNTLDGNPVGNDEDLQQFTTAVINGVDGYGRTIDDIVAGVEEIVRRARETSGPNREKNIADAEAMLDKAKRVRDGDVKPGGALYEVEIDADVDDLLDQSSPLSEQPQMMAKIQDLLRQAGADETIITDDMHGKEAYDELSAVLGSDKAASEALRDAGVPGSSYKWFDAKNFVIFDDRVLKILKRDGEPVSSEERQEVVDDLMAMRRQPSAQEPQALGQTDPYNMVISIAAKAIEAEAAAKGVSPEQEGVRVLRHEAVEFFKSMGLFRPKEWQLLQRTANNKGWIETTGVRQSYTDLYQQGMSEDELNDLLIKEAIAEQYSEFHINNKKFTPAVTRVFQRIKDFLTRAMNSLRGMGFQKWDDIFTKIDQGEFKRRYDQAFGVTRPQGQAQGGVQPIVRAGQLPDVRGRQPAAQPSPVLQGISETIDDFKRALGMTVRQGRLDPGLKRAMRAAGGGDVVGQFSRDTGITRLQVSNDFDALTHEGGHHLEARYGAELDAIKQQFASELSPLASPGKDQISEGFAEFFRRYITNPQMAQTRAPGFYNAFEEFLDGQDPDVLTGLQGVQQAYDSYIQGDPTEAKMANQTVLAGREGMFSRFIDDAEKNGLKNTMADRLHVLYYNMIGKNHGWWLGTKQMLDLIEQNTGARVNLKAIDNPNKLLRRINHTTAWAMRALKDGISLASAPNGGGVSMHDVLHTAIGSGGKKAWNKENAMQFGDYLISRRAVHLYVRHRPQLRQAVQQFVSQNPSIDYLLPRLPVNTESTLEHAPTLEPLMDHLRSLVDHEARNPQFRQAAELYYQFNKDVLRFLAEKGLISQEDFTRLSVDTDYAPFQRDMSDRVLATGSQASRRAGGDAAKVNKYDVYKTIKGSTRDIINPIQSTVQFVYEMHLRAAINDTAKAMDRLASAAGPGGGAIFERLPPNEASGYTVQIQQALRSAAKDAGMSDADSVAMLGNVEQYLGNNASTMIFTQGQAKERGERIIWFYEDGKPVPARLGDAELGRMMFEAFSTMGRRSPDLWLKLLAIPAQAVRIGVTNSFEFIFRNIFVDAFAAPVNSPYATPVVTQISGLKEILGGGKHHQLYNRYAGMMGGELIQSISDQSINRDIRSLENKGFQIRRPRSIGEFAKMIFQLGEFTETATRVGIFKKAFESAKADGMSDVESAAEAAFAAHDVIDFSRNGSRTEALRRVITFWNAAMQGMDKYSRSMLAMGDRGSAYMAAGRLGEKSNIAAAFVPYMKYRAGSKLTKSELRDLGQSAKAWAYTTLVMGGMSYIFYMLGEDDELVDEVPDRLKATHWIVSINGALHMLPKDLKTFLDLPEESDNIIRLPKPFEIAWFANAVERGLAGARKGDPTAFNDYLKDFWEITHPPEGVPGLDLPYEMLSGKSFYTKRDIIPTFEQDLERRDQYGPYTTATARAIGDAINVSPYYVDHVVRGIGASVARDVQTVVDQAVQKGPSPRVEEFPVARRFSYNVARNSESIGKFYDLYYSSEGMVSWFWDSVSSDARSFLSAKNSYKSLVDDDKLAAADDLYQRFNPDQKVFAVLGAHFTGSGKSKYRNLHPMENAADGVTVTNKVMKEVVTGELLVGKKEEHVKLDRALMSFARNELGHIRRGMAQNGLQIMGVPGWANQKMMDLDKRMKTLQSGAPQVYDELIRRLQKKRFLDFKHLKNVWPEVKERVLAEKDHASLGDLVAGGAVQPNFEAAQ
jgi:hypothetical protein